MIAMVILHLALPLAIVVPSPFSYTGVAVMAAGVAMIVWSRRAYGPEVHRIPRPPIEAVANQRCGFGERRDRSRCCLNRPGSTQSR